MLQPEYTTQFKKDIKIMQKRNENMSLLKDIINILCEEKPIPEKYKDHLLTGNWKGCRDCHIKPDWLLIYQTNDSMIVFHRTGTHSDLF